MEFASNERELLIQIRKAMRYEDADKEFPSENWATDVLHKFKTRIRAMLTTPVKDYEVEARYGKYKEGCFYPGLSYSIFENVNGRLAQLCSNENGQPEHTRTLIEGSGIRKITDLTHADKKPIYQRNGEILPNTHDSYFFGSIIQKAHFGMHSANEEVVDPIKYGPITLFPVKFLDWFNNAAFN